MAALEVLVERCAAREVRCRWIPVDYASHSGQVEGIEGELLECLAGIEAGPGEVPLYSTLAGAVVDGAVMGPRYWYENLRHTVEFQDTIRALLDDGHRLFVEISPHPVLSTGLHDILDHTDTDTDTGTGAGGESGVRAVVLDTLHRDQAGAHRFHTALAAAQVHLHTPHWHTRT
ncbi:acyltransferase domain-containing protein, partial [Streptomyces boncukensis]|uniref:acyltransferase domain-containing protein n=1 Tax=Streptomyces boncukensis TaxID=2711219 RepID=UPI0030B9FD12